MSDRPAFVCVAHVLLEDAAGRLALFRRAGTGFMDGWFSLPGGHQEVGEGVAAAASRELLEETGVTARALVPMAVLPYRSGRFQGNNFVFRCCRWDGQPRPAADAFDALSWCERDALPEKTVPWLAEVLDLAARGEWFRELDY